MRSKKHLYFILTNENLFHPRYFAGVLRLLDNQKYKVVGVTQVIERRKSFINFLTRQLNLWGWLGFLAIGVSSVLAKKSSPLKLITQKYKIKYFEIKDVNAKSHLRHIKKFEPDIILSSCGQIFGKELLDLPKIACINRHSALLPKYGGVLPVFWAMYHNEKKFGVSIHIMVEKVDQGDIIYQKAISRNYKNSLFSNYVIAFQESIQATIEALNNLNKNKIVKRFAPNKKQYFSYPSPSDIRKFKKRNKSFSLMDLKYFLYFFGNYKKVIS
ncbi:hypothetical protein A2975_04765 [Candidatus Woesebacteria bacterium RIFCSPLOWO2_01_FULL_44_14]|uniref:Formyl transferase N-terminal domain-containing protein n=1 Tax=Candidatus Woesebacteria bacterium RIFCSPLOWO2_01_FULL_44_14 TaxID=1802525 RepID=A0A1F8C0U6_9BACT|nr:MAG: hypothetical protein A2975_04765 [Candidatus Woesebacteria bacterium RIFCSPLOWO2_01_FULL_44_14]